MAVRCAEVFKGGGGGDGGVKGNVKNANVSKTFAVLSVYSPLSFRFHLL